MTSGTTQRGPATEVAIHNIARLKPEHGVLLRTLLADPGMSAATLEVLVEHLLEEEGPALQQVVARAKLGVSAALASTTVRAGASVGDLRGQDPPPHAAERAGATVGALRRS
ncbi:MAG: hypothetical protein ACK6CU_00860 [Deltaproteobacteria bacterium]|jgi:hypothetical protein